jgi:flagellar FliL protein
MKSKLKFIIPIVVVVLGGAYKFVLAKPAPAQEHKIEGTVYVLPKEFLVNLADGRFAKLGIGLVLDPHDTSAAPAAGHGAAAKPPEGFGTMPQEAVIRDIVTDVITDRADRDLIDRKGRRKLKERILKAIKKHTDVKVEDILFTDVAVQ